MAGKKGAKSKLTSKQRGFFIFMGVTLCLVAGGILWFNGRVSTLDCRRVESTQIECDLQTRWLGLLPLTQQTVSGLTGAAVEPNCSRELNSNSSEKTLETCIYSVTLATTAGPVDMSPALASGGNEEQKYNVVAQINAFVENPAVPTLAVAQSELGPQTVVMGLLFMVGLALVGVNAARIIADKR